MKKRYLVSASGTEALGETVIEAATAEESRELYEEAWQAGQIAAFGYEFSDWNIVEEQEGDLSIKEVKSHVKS